MRRLGAAVKQDEQRSVLLRRRPMPTLLEAALDAEHRGYSVIPVNPRSKHPAVKWKSAQTTRAARTREGGH
jgi:hypothetical protein